MARGRKARQGILCLKLRADDLEFVVCNQSQSCFKKRV